jgi:hypothetical protein
MSAEHRELFGPSHGKSIWAEAHGFSDARRDGEAHGDSPIIALKMSFFCFSKMSFLDRGLTLFHVPYYYKNQQI